ncbi:unnamed protein product [Prunus armeniaca]
MSHSDPSLLMKISYSVIVVLLLYVDDIILTGSNSQISYKSNGDIFISQQKYAKDLLVKAGMESCKSCLTPSKPHT